MPDPPHPGEFVKYECLEPLGLPVERAAEGLGVTRQELLDLVNEKSPVTVDMAFRLSKAFGSSPELWLRLQMSYDIWQARERTEKFEVEQFWIPGYETNDGDWVPGRAASGEVLAETG
jgi:addiction module HigA family antidote